MSDQIVIGFGWRAAVDREVQRMQMMSLGPGGERPMVRELRLFVVSVTDKNEAEFMSRFWQFGALDDLNAPLHFPPRSWSHWKCWGLVAVRFLMLLPLRLLGFRSPMKTKKVNHSPFLSKTEDMDYAKLMQINNEVVGFVSLGRRKNDFDEYGVEMR